MLGTLIELRYQHRLALERAPRGPEAMYHAQAFAALAVAVLEEARREMRDHEPVGYLVGDHEETWREAERDLEADQTAAAREGMQ